ncbi:MAG: type II toxin-antitoxin system VapC family toxin [Hymenobacter sp.]|nr:MAG: type II toxin-antitoxin system VapC family toxin [Hymenobacter sp.]
MGPYFLADTNAGIDFLNGKLPAASAAWVQQLLDEQQLVLSVVVRIELLSWSGSPADMQPVEEFIAASLVLPLDESVIQQTIRLRQQHRIKLPDAIIAATALAHGLPLLTRNVSDFRAIAGLVVVNPHDSAAISIL